MSAPVAPETRSLQGAKGDQHMLGRRAEPGGGQQGTEFVAVQGDG